MESFFINAPAKINIGLDVLGRREDGYHEVRMIMQSIRLFDRLTLTKSATPGVRLKTNLPFLPINKDNLVVQSANMLFQEFAPDAGVDIVLEKRIPVAAGMAGGSTDAASCMLAINELFDLGLPKRSLMKRAVHIGADVPYCIMKGTALSEGIGEKLSTIKSVYSNLVLDENTKHPDIDRMILAMKKRDIYDLSQHIGNILETVTIPAHPEIATIKECMMQNGALGSLMSGSGPTVFGIYDDKDKAIAAKKKCLELPFRCFAYSTDLYR